ncbi:hypothetical protein H6P81_014656 [Aristolochia fimbriata]|uniref:Myb-like domain-containing protein n=1 Tax=Aristolochia fimbriata TaxID=158543 RepID=A0AAV7E4J2_ARIFI|nr:hypothetical protein H6P81_014656 [Aristolochia fimbriata]
MEETIHLEKKNIRSKKDKECFSTTAAVNHCGIIGTHIDSHNMDSDIDLGCRDVKEVPQREKKKKKRKFETMNGLDDDSGIVKPVDDGELGISKPMKVISHEEKKNTKEKDACLFPRTDDAKVFEIGEQTSKKHRMVMNDLEIDKEENGEKIENQEAVNDAKIRKREKKLQKKKDIFNDGEQSSGVVSQEYVIFMDKVEKSKNVHEEKNNHVKDKDTFITSNESETKKFSNRMKKSFPTEENDDEVKEKVKEQKKEKKKEKKKYILKSDELVSGNGSLNSVMFVNEKGKSKNDHKETKNHLKDKDASPSPDGPSTEESSKGSKMAIPDEDISSNSVVKGSNGKKKKKKREVFKKNGNEITIKVSKTKMLDSFEKVIAGEDISLKYYEGESNAEKRMQNEDDHFSHVKPSKKHKRVSFSSKVEVFPNDKNSSAEEYAGDLVRGKRFSQEEDEILKKAVFDYIKENNLGDNGLEKVLNGRKHGLKGCWNEIAAALPWRPVLSVSHRAHIIFERSEKHFWEPYEYEMIQRHYEVHGGDWKSLAAQLGRCRKHLRETWRRINLPNKRTGHWKQDEYRALFDLVNKDREMRKFEKQDSLYGMLRENISWEAISHVIGTRTGGDCCRKWYNQLLSPMVKDGIWDVDDDNRLLEELLNLDASSLEDVDWDSLLDNRTGEICRKRWSQMTKHIGEYQDRPFGEQVELLIYRYCPNLLAYSDESEGSGQKVPAP